MINCIVLMGRLTADPELRTTQSGLSVTRFSMAVDRNYSEQNGERSADFIEVVAWRQQAEFVTKYFRKGSMIAVQGSLQTRKYEDRNGNKRTAYEVIASQVSFTGSKEDGGQKKEPAQTVTSYSNAGAEDFGNVVGDDDDFPF